jgi:hypothetical protein
MYRFLTTATYFFYISTARHQMRVMPMQILHYKALYCFHQGPCPRIAINQLLSTVAQARALLLPPLAQRLREEDSSVNIYQNARAPRSTRPHVREM